MMSLLERSSKAKARLASVKERGGILAVLRTEGGAIDLASIMVGVLVIGIIGGVIAATVFAVIPWAQQNAAKANLDSVKTAESVQVAQSAGAGAGVFVSDANLAIATGNAAQKILLPANPRVRVDVSTLGDHFIALSVSADGTQYYTTDLNSVASTTAPAAATGTDAQVVPVWASATSLFTA